MTRKAAAAIVPLAEGFERPSREDWLALVERTLKGAPVASLTRRTIEGLAIEPPRCSGSSAAERTSTAW